MVDPFDLGEVPFYWRVKQTAMQPPHDVPARLPFAFSFIDDLQLVIQERNPLVLQWLERVYKENANVGYLQDGHALAESYGGEFIDFFRRACAMLSKPPTSAADIGCGGVYLLQRLRELGLNVKGIDPSPVTSVVGNKAGIEIVPDFYPSAALTEQFDVLFHYDVLEHVEDPVAFLRAHHSNLNPQGALIFAVPDCTKHIRLGDVSMALHEHLNYFDDASLERVVRAAGFCPLLLQPAAHGGVLLCCAVPDAGGSELPAAVNDHEKFDTFCRKATRAMQHFAARAAVDGELGLYVPLRAFPYLGCVPEGQAIRFFDDDPGLKGCYYDGMDVPVESSQGLQARPLARVIICSLVFGDKIAGRLRADTQHSLDIVLWSDLFVETD